MKQRFGEALESRRLKRFVNLSLALLAVFLICQLYCAGIIVSDHTYQVCRLYHFP